MGKSGLSATGESISYGAFWLDAVPQHWDLVPAWTLWRERSERCHEDDVHLTPSQSHGVISQQEYMEITGNKVVLNLSGSSSMKHVEPGDFIIHLRSFQGGLEYSEQAGKISNAYTILQPAVEHVPSYFRWLFKSSAFISGLAGSTDQLRDGQSINFKKFSTFTLPLPDLDTQRRIADYLDAETAQIDALVAELDGYVELLEKRKKTVFSNELFGRSESTNSKLLHSDIGDIPDNWEVSKFSIEMTESTEVNGHAPVGQLLSISEFRGVEPNSRKDGEGQQASEDLSKYRVVRPKQLAANMMWLDHGGIAVSELEGHISPDYRAFDISKRLNPSFVHYLLRSSEYIGYFSTIAVGVRPNAKRTNKTTLGMTPIPIPPLDKQEEIARHIIEELTRTDTIITECLELKELLLKRRKVLITDCVTGKVEV